VLFFALPEISTHNFLQTYTHVVHPAEEPGAERCACSAAPWDEW